MEHLKAKIGWVGKKEVIESCAMRKQWVTLWTPGLVEWVKRSTQRCDGHIKKIPEERQARGVYQSNAIGVLAIGDMGSRGGTIHEGKS